MAITSLSFFSFPLFRTTALLFFTFLFAHYLESLSFSLNLKKYAIKKALTPSVSISFQTNQSPQGFNPNVSFPETIPSLLESFEKTIEVSLHEGTKEQLTLNLCDSANSADYDALRPRPQLDVDLVVLLFAIDSRINYENVRTKWYPQVSHLYPEAPILLIGNKIDIRETPNAAGRPEFISRAEGEELRKEIKAKAYHETSALASIGLEELFQSAARLILLNGSSVAQREPVLFENGDNEDKNDRKCVLM